jgi:hypothetical protein
MSQNPTSGPLSYLNWGFESTYGTAVTAGRTFGHGNKGNISAKNNMERIYGLGNRNATAEVAKKFEISGGAEFMLSHGTFFRAVLGSVADAGAGPYTHTYSEANTVPSMTIIAGAEMGTNDMIYAITGVKINTCTLTAAVGEVAKVKLDWLGKSVSVTTSSIGSQVAPTEDVFTFAHGSLNFGGSTIANVQNFELTINNSLELVWGLGDRTATAGVEKSREYNIKATYVLSDVTTFMTTFLGDSSSPYVPQSIVPTTASLVLTFTNSAATTSLRSIVITLANIYLDEDSFSLDPAELVKEDVTGHALSCSSIVWTNNTALDNASP